MKIDAVFRKPRLLRALTTLEVGEFERLLAAFEAAWQEQRGARTHHGQTRQRQPGGGHKGTLVTAREKLFFVLFYFKCYPLQEVMALFFDLSQPRVSHWVGELTPLVNAALGRELLLPAKKPADLEKLLAEVPDVLLLIDGTERPIRRPKNKEEQKTRRALRRRSTRARKSRPGGSASLRRWRAWCRGRGWWR